MSKTIPTNTISPSLPDGASKYQDLEATVKACVSSAINSEPLPALPTNVSAALSDTSRPEGGKPTYIEPQLIKSSCKLPEYPTSSLTADATGTTTLAFNIGVRGRPTEAEIIRSAGRTAAHKLLDVTALFALMQCNFEPATLEGKPVTAWVNISYIWSIR
jgi:TonB family protein